MTPLLAAWLIAATPSQCQPLWPKVFAALEKEGEPFEKSQLARKVPGAKDKLRLAWLERCAGFSPEVLACATGADLAAELAEARRVLEEGRTPKDEVEKILARLRADWKIFDCKEVSSAVDAAARQVAIDAGLEKP